MKKVLIFGYLFCSFSLAIAHGGGQDSQGGHFDTSDNTYHCHAPSGCVDLDDVYFTVTDVKDGDTIDVTHLEYTVTVRTNTKSEMSLYQHKRKQRPKTRACGVTRTAQLLFLPRYKTLFSGRNMAI